MKKIFCLLLPLAVLAASCSKDRTPAPAAVNQYLISAVKAGTVQKAFLQAALSSYPDYASYATLPGTNVSLYRVSYYTEYPRGTKIAASGVLMVPDNLDPAFPAVVYTHGSIVKADAPSRRIASPLNYTAEVMVGAVMSSAFDCAVVMPDYVGYGDSESITHPYNHARSLGQASLDIILAFREYCVSAGLSFNDKVLITGYSEGGFAALALDRMIQEGSTGLQVVKTVAGSGAYDNVAFAKAFLGQNADLDPSFLSTYLWAMQMYKTDFAYSKSYDDIFSAADNPVLKAAGYNMAYYGTYYLPIDTNPSLLFKKEFVDGVLTGSDTEFMNILSDNSLTGFVPADSVIFVCGTSDTWVYPVNTYNAYNAMTARGCKVKLYKCEGGDHTTTVPTYMDVVLARLRMTY